MKPILTPITLAAAAGALAVGAAGGAVAASAASAPAPSAAQIRSRCEQRATIRTKLRAAFKAERQKENVLRLDPGKRQEIAKPILDQAVAGGDLRAQARDRILSSLGRANRPGRP
ncbi:MAG TPA: hypothetical protein VHR88_12650 [Solirubrobacteraceae bacterium]|jgi:hypothetical protein|nr:hypothetical protein [Solirubrobacteraceae bacterium]